MNGVIVLHSDSYDVLTIVPSDCGIIYRSQLQGNDATCILPLYEGIEVGDNYRLCIDTDKGHSWYCCGTINSVTEKVERTVCYELFKDAGTVTTYYFIEKNNGVKGSIRLTYVVMD